jgi:hypothetical protein
LISGGQALVEISVPTEANVQNLAVHLNGRDLSARFARRSDGRIIGLVDHLVVGRNTLIARLGSGDAQQLIITNHPIGGPIISGPQIQPWRCHTVEAGLGPATDAQCDAPTKFSLLYKDSTTGKFRPYNANTPPRVSDIARTTTDEGRTVPFVVRIETGAMDRGIYFLAVLYDPSKPWEPWAPQSGWNQKLVWHFWGGAGTAHNQGAERFPLTDTDTNAFAQRERDEMEDQLGRGAMVGYSTLTVLGHQMNTVVMAEFLMMVKEHIEDSYGEIRYTMSQGGSGGAIAQFYVANDYPGLLQGLVPTLSYPDLWSFMAVNTPNCALLNRYFDEIGHGVTDTQKNAVYGYGMESPDGTGYEFSGYDFCHGLGGGNALRIYLYPQLGGSDIVGGGGTPCVPRDVAYDPKTNRAGVRCDFFDYLANILGLRPPSAWNLVERDIRRGFANRFLDNVGVQYGLQALEAGKIPPELFVDLNEKIGGWDIDSNWQVERTEADPRALLQAYRSGLIVEGRELRTVAIMDYRGDAVANMHSNRQASYIPARLKHYNGTAANDAEWVEPTTGPGGLPVASDPELAMNVLDAWLAKVDSDRSDVPLAQKIIRDRPAEAADGCFVNGKRAQASACADYKLDNDPLIVAGEPSATRDILKCRLKPLRRQDYKVTFTDEEWSRLRATFPTGVCDWSKPGVDQQFNIPWLDYSGGIGGKVLPAAPVSTAISAD